MNCIMHSQTNHVQNDFSHKSHFMVLFLKNFLMHSQTNAQNDFSHSTFVWFCFWMNFLMHSQTKDALKDFSHKSNLYGYFLSVLSMSSPTFPVWNKYMRLKMLRTRKLFLTLITVISLFCLNELYILIDFCIFFVCINFTSQASVASHIKYVSVSLF